MQRNTPRGTRATLRRVIARGKEFAYPQLPKGGLTRAPARDPVDGAA